MKDNIKTFASLYNYLEAQPENKTFLNHLESEKWKNCSKSEFLETVRYLTLAFEAKGWRGKQIALVISPSVYWLMILHTGDLATIDEEGYITITGRKKELSKTSTGEYISVNYIEQLLAASGWFDHVLIVGNNRPFVVALLMVDEVAISEYASNNGFINGEEAVDSEKFNKEINGLISRINKKLNHWERIRGFHLVTETLTIEAGELTPSMKLARKRVQKRFEEEIEHMYKGYV